jgi:Yip1 domain
MVDLSGIDHKTIVERVKSIILTPKEEWSRIATDAQSQRDILTGYVLPLAAIGPVSSLIGSQLFGYGALGFSYRPSLIGALSTAVISFALGIIGVFILAFIADFLAPKFGGQSNRLNAFKLVAFGSTAMWLAGIFGLIPSLGFFSLLGLYSIYLYYTGAEPLMKVPANQSGAYTAVTILCAILMSFLIAPITVAITGLFAFSGMSSIAGNTEAGGKLTLPGGGTIDTGNAEKIGKQFEDMANGKAPPIEVAKLQALLPASIGAYQRTVVESTGMGAVGGAAEGTYAAGDNSFRLKIVDMSALGAIAGIGAAMGAQHSREDADSYERTTTVGGQLQSESWNKSNRDGKFSIVVANRFMIEAEGKAASIDELKAAVATIDQGNLLSLAG